MIDLNTIQDMLDQIAEELPSAVFDGLNGGVVLVPEIKYHPESRREELLILGEYHISQMMGRYITIYGGSFLHLFSNQSEKTMYNELEKTLKHELTHHIESLAGEDDLALEDAIRLYEYKNDEQE